MNFIWVTFYAVGLMYPVLQIIYLRRQKTRRMILVWAAAASLVIAGGTLTAWTAVEAPELNVIAALGIAVATIGAAWGSIGLVINLCVWFYKRIRRSTRPPVCR